MLALDYSIFYTEGHYLFKLIYKHITIKENDGARSGSVFSSQF